jgi:hypothetical protein
MGILDDIERLGVELEDRDKEAIDDIVAYIRGEKKDELIQNALIEGAVGEFLSVFCPEAMNAIVADRNRQAEEWMRKTTRKYDEKGNRVCEEDLCPSIKEVSQCVYCGKYICEEHNYIHGSKCCYDCYIFHFGEQLDGRLGEKEGQPSINEQ